MGILRRGWRKRLSSKKDERVGSRETKEREK
jgi:hypothetical protein